MQNGTFRMALFGGYNRDDVEEYIQSLEHEIESIKMLHQKEKQELMRKVEDREVELEQTRSELQLARKQTEASDIGEEETEALEMLESEIRKETEQTENSLDKNIKGKEVQAEENREKDKIHMTAFVQLQKEFEQLQKENGELKEKLGKKDDLFDYDTISKVMEEARTNAELIEKEAKERAEQIVKEAKNRAQEEEEKQRHMIAARINAQLEEKGIQLMAAKYKIEQYMKEINSAQQGLYLLNNRMEKMVKDMPVRLDDYWEGDEFRKLEKKVDGSADGTVYETSHS